MIIQRHSRSPHHHQRIRSRNRSRRRYNLQGKLCFFHFRFGKKCLPEKYVQPCSWSDPGNPLQQQTPRRVLLQMSYLAENPVYLSGAEKQAANPLWTVVQACQ
ncbi:hypothetical protein AVEN_86726-1 [Araneus ventricosus]|uniref:Uncharacterized protein n=1 Tax=Araneus ventricosus TaxID=182803 RepID=A0A4Y2HIK0_ARAVE|nr:hypothetical protein AVEN_86726-1 [Araneus ventricosus]